MVAEDQIINLHLIKSQLAEFGVADQTIFCTNGTEAVEKIKEELQGSNNAENPISLILSDFQMPQKNGIQVLQDVKSLYKRHGLEGQEPMFVILTAFVSQGFRKYAAQEGVE